MRKVNGPVVLVVLDGWGIDTDKEHNGVHLARTPNFDRLSKEYPYTELAASGEAVGLPDGQMGNSEVGHTTIGAGTVIYQDLVRIHKDVESGNFGKNSALVEAFNHAQQHGSQLHVIGLLSPGGVHSHEDHFLQVIHEAEKAGLKHIVAHPILDGRDHSPTHGTLSLKRLEKECCDLSKCVIATVSGRYYPMDRDKNWDRTDKGFQALWNGQAKHTYAHTDHPSDVVKSFYEKGQYDELLEPMVFTGQDGKPYTVQPNDAIIFTNFRADRTKQLSAKIGEKIGDYNLCFVTMTDYGRDITSVVAYEPQSIEATIASCVSEAGLKQSHLAETDKYAHATYFLNGGKEDKHDGEEHILVPSRKDVKTHDQAPEMKAKELTEETIKRLPIDDFIFLNWANPDMVGHTAVREAIITAVETVDAELGKLSEAVLAHNGLMIAIADHGNAERMIDPETGKPHTSHTSNPVPCIIISNEHKEITLTKDGGLKDIAPTVLGLLGIEKPNSMTGETLILDRP